MIKKLLSTVLISSLLTSSMAFGMDVRPVKAQERFFIKVTKNSNQTVSFDKCETANENACTQMGNKSSYKVSELKDARKHFKRRGYATAAGEAAVVLVVGAATVGVGAIAIAGAGASLTTNLAAQLVGLTAVTSGTAVAAFAGVNAAIDAINPLKQFERANCISDDLINDKTILVEDMSEVIENVDHVLKSIS